MTTSGSCRQSGAPLEHLVTSGLSRIGWPGLLYLILVAMETVRTELLMETVRFEHEAGWLDAYNHCEKKGLRLPGIEELQNNSTLLEYISENSRLPVWTYGFQYTRKSADSVVFQSKNRTGTAGVMCVKDNVLNHFVLSKRMTFDEVYRYCQNEHNSTVVGDLDARNVFLRKYSKGMGNLSIWTENINLTNLLQESQVRCVLLDRAGRPVTDHCSTSLSVVCLEGEVQTTFEFRNWELPVYDPEQDTTPAGTSATSNRIRISSSEAILNSTTHRDNTVGQSTKTTNDYRSPGTIWQDTDIMFTFVGVGVALALVILVVLTCCCLCRGRRRRKPDGPQLSDVYSDAVDSISMKQRGVKDSDYAIPEDAIRKARQRHSIGEGEYDTIPETVKKMSMKQQDSPNIYSHVTVGYPPNMYENPEENPYDVSSVAKHKPCIVTISSNDENHYGHLNNPS